MVTIALRDVLAHPSRVVATVLAVVLGVGFMSGTLILGATVTRSFDDVFADVYAHIDAVVRSTDTVESPFGPDRDRIDDELVAEVAAVEGVAAVDGHVQGELRIIGPDGEPLGTPRGGPPTFGLDWPDAPELTRWEVVEGRPPRGPDEVVLDLRTATETGFGPGDTVLIAVPLGTREMTVVGTARFGDLDNYSGVATALFDTPTAQELVGEPGRFEWLSVAASEGTTPEELARRLEQALPAGAEALTGEEFTEESQNLFAQFIDTFTYLLFGFGVVAMFVGMFIIYNTFTIIVAQRTRELALLRAVGAGRGQILRSVVVEAAVVGVVASALGLGFGVVVARGLQEVLGGIGFALPSTPLVVTVERLALPAGLAVGMTLFAALTPALRATRVPPVTAMREVAIDRPTGTAVRIAAAVVFVALSAALVGNGMRSGEREAVVWVLAASIPAFLAAFSVGPLYARPVASALGAPFARLRGITGVLARENALRNPTRTSTTAVALTVGVGLITMITVAGSSMRSSVEAAIEGGVRADFVVSADSFGGISPAVAAELGALDEVAVATGLRLGRAELDGDGRFLAAVDADAIEAVVDLPVVEGDLADLDAEGLAARVDTARKAGWALGDRVTVRFPGRPERQLELVATFESETFDRGGAVLVDHDLFDAEVPTTGQLDQQVYVVLRDGVSVAEAEPALAEVMGRHPTASLEDLDGFKADRAAEFTQRLTFLYALLGLAVIVGVIGVVNTLLLSVMERTRELGLLRAVGASRRQLRSMVLQESVIIALLGTATGLAIGLVLGWAMVATIEIGIAATFHVPVAQLAGFVGLAGVAGVVAGVWPAVRAGRLRLLDAIAME